MSRRSTRLLTLEKSLYKYNNNKEVWEVKSIEGQEKNKENFFDSGSFFTSKAMSQKVSPISYRLGQSITWYSTYYSKIKSSSLPNEYSDLEIDNFIREYIESLSKSLKVIINKIEIKRVKSNYFIRIYLLDHLLNKEKKPFLKKEQAILFKDYLKNIDFKEEEKILNPFFIEKDEKGKKNYYLNSKLFLDHIDDMVSNYCNINSYSSIFYEKDIGNSASLLSKLLSFYIEEKKPNFKFALKESLKQIKSLSSLRGLRVNCSGRLGRAPMAKMEWFTYGSIPLSRIKAKVDYNQISGKTKYGSFGLKVWLYKY